MKITTFIAEVGAPNYKQVAKKLMAKYEHITKPEAVCVAKLIIEYNSKSKSHHPQKTLDTIRKAMNDQLFTMNVDAYLSAA